MNKYSVRLYFWGIFLVMMFVFLFGFALPSLISAANTELFLIGVFTIICLPVMIGYIIMKKIIPLIKKLKEN